LNFFWMQQTTRDYLSRVELVWLQGAAIVGNACIQYALLPPTAIERGCSMEPIMLKTVS